ncbi:MAG: hypothetical protein HBSIN02_24960 [Bacteroidia bacterium]|nr:MAG: hypothetical protein HBSIN02_24960 [Bacteroidia bacterium]
METRHGVKGTIDNEIFFTESAISGASIIRHVHARINRQNSNLEEVKRELAQQAKSLGANTIMNFRYGQKKHQWWELVFTFRWDTESWYGEGDAIRA